MNGSNFTVPLVRAVGRLPQHLASLFPLLTRELTEQSARRRTYILRVIYAVALYGFTLWAFWNELGGWSNQSFAFLGRGRQFFEGLAWLQFCGLYLFLPAMTSGVLTIEKERDTLSLLLLTRLGPWSILIGKLFSRLVPMASFVMLSLPLVAVAYSLGGVNERDILSLAWTLSVTALQVSTLALACSAWFRTTAAAFIATYLIGAAVILGPLLVTLGGDYDPFGLVEFVREFCEEQGLGGNELPGFRGGQTFTRSDAAMLLFGPWVNLHPSALNLPFDVIVRRTIPMLMFAGACLAFARVVLWRRAFVQPSNFLLKVFRSLDKLFHRMNQNRLTRGIVLTREHVTLPVFDPIRWRETTKRSLGTTRYLIRMLLVLEVPVLFGLVLGLQMSYDGHSSYRTTVPNVAAWILWVVAALVIAIQSTGMIGAERSRQTLDVLLTTPMTSETIVREKFAGVWRIIRMLWIPFLTVYLFQAWWGSWVGSEPVSHTVYGLVRGGLAMAIYPALVAWLGFHFGMRCRSQTQAALVTISLIAGVCLIPIVIAETLKTIEMDMIYGLRWISPAIPLTQDMRNYLSLDFRYQYNSPYFGYDPFTWLWKGLLVHFAFAGTLLIWLWYRGLKTFGSRVNRNDGQIVDDDDIDRLSELRRKIVGGGVFRDRSETDPEDG
jgi:ABC-type transport system involved in multi-copper enzyme maturation permease subunit